MLCAANGTKTGLDCVPRGVEQIIQIIEGMHKMSFSDELQCIRILDGALFTDSGVNGDCTFYSQMTHNAN